MREFSTNNCKQQLKRRRPTVDEEYQPLHLENNRNNNHSMTTITCSITVAALPPIISSSTQYQNVTCIPSSINQNKSSGNTVAGVENDWSSFRLSIIFQNMHLTKNMILSIIVHWGLILMMSSCCWTSATLYNYGDIQSRGIPDVKSHHSWWVVAYSSQHFFRPRIKIGKPSDGNVKISSLFPYPAAIIQHRMTANTSKKQRELEQDDANVAIRAPSGEYNVTPSSLSTSPSSIPTKVVLGPSFESLPSIEPISSEWIVKPSEPVWDQNLTRQPAWYMQSNSKSPVTTPVPNHFNLFRPSAKAAIPAKQPIVSYAIRKPASDMIEPTLGQSELVEPPATKSSSRRMLSGTPTSPINDELNTNYSTRWTEVEVPIQFFVALPSTQGDRRMLELTKKNGKLLEAFQDTINSLVQRLDKPETAKTSQIFSDTKRKLQQSMQSVLTSVETTLTEYMTNILGEAIRDPTNVKLEKLTLTAVQVSNRRRRKLQERRFLRKLLSSDNEENLKLTGTAEYVINATAISKEDFASQSSKVIARAVSDEGVLQQVLIDAGIGTTNDFNGASAQSSLTSNGKEKPTLTEIIIGFVLLAATLVSLLFWAAVLLKKCQKRRRRKRLAAMRKNSVTIGGSASGIYKQNSERPMLPKLLPTTSNSSGNPLMTQPTPTLTVLSLQNGNNDSDDDSEMYYDGLKGVATSEPATTEDDDGSQFTQELQKAASLDMERQREQAARKSSNQQPITSSFPSYNSFLLGAPTVVDPDLQNTSFPYGDEDFQNSVEMAVRETANDNMITDFSPYGNGDSANPLTTDKRTSRQIVNSPDKNSSRSDESRLTSAASTEKFRNSSNANNIKSEVVQRSKTPTVPTDSYRFSVAAATEAILRSTAGLNLDYESSDSSSVISDTHLAVMPSDLADKSDDDDNESVQAELTRSMIQEVNDIALYVEKYNSSKENRSPTIPAQLQNNRHLPNVISAMNASVKTEASSRSRGVKASDGSNIQNQKDYLTSPYSLDGTSNSAVMSYDAFPDDDDSDEEDYILATSTNEDDHSQRLGIGRFTVEKPLLNEKTLGIATANVSKPQGYMKSGTNSSNAVDAMLDKENPGLLSLKTKTSTPTRNSKPMSDNNVVAEDSTKDTKRPLSNAREFKQNVLTKDTSKRPAKEIQTKVDDPVTPSTAAATRVRSQNGIFNNIISMFDSKKTPPIVPPSDSWQYGVTFPPDSKKK